MDFTMHKGRMAEGFSGSALMHPLFVLWPGPLTSDGKPLKNGDSLGSTHTENHRVKEVYQYAIKTPKTLLLS